MNLQTSIPQALAGSIRRFGPHGVLYQIIRILDGQRALVRVIETGEETLYLLDKILADPTN
jgi:hypothetical protein